VTAGAAMAIGSPSPSKGEGAAAPMLQELAGGRLHLSHGPIDVVLKAFGAENAVRPAHAAAIDRFATVLEELCAELPALRARAGTAEPRSLVGRRMAGACAPFQNIFITPMAAVAGSVADELLSVMLSAAPLERAFVNDGGDIAVFCAPGQSLDIAIAGDFSRGSIPGRSGTISIRHGDGVGGIATSGARGRSFSLGIADSVTVLAHDAAAADAAATLIANAVDCEDAAIERGAAVNLDPDSDLGDRLVTVAVGRLAPEKRDTALAAGLARARDYRARGLIIDAALTLQGETLTLSDNLGSSNSLMVRCERGARASNHEGSSCLTAQPDIPSFEARRFTRLAPQDEVGESERIAS
jgi:ApbE superfamily uncharacterized protein (UPF0280 family)